MRRTLVALVLVALALAGGLLLALAGGVVRKPEATSGRSAARQRPGGGPPAPPGAGLVPSPALGDAAAILDAWSFPGAAVVGSHTASVTTGVSSRDRQPLPYERELRTDAAPARVWRFYARRAGVRDEQATVVPGWEIPEGDWWTVEKSPPHRQPRPGAGGAGDGRVHPRERAGGNLRHARAPARPPGEPGLHPPGFPLKRQPAAGPSPV